MVPFAGGATELDDRAKRRLTALVPLLLGKPNVVEIRGRLSGTALPSEGLVRDAWELSFARCAAVRTFLMDAGVDSERIRLSQTGAVEPYVLPHEPSQAADPASYSRVSFDITAYDEMVRLTVTHDELQAGSPMARGIQQGWPIVLSSLKSLLETGQGIDVFAKPKAALHAA